MTQPDPQLIAQWRKGIGSCHSVLLPDGRPFVIMWRHYDQFGVRNYETGEQYAFSYVQAIQQRLVPLILCPMNMESVKL